MSGLTPLVDTLLATRLAQRVDLVPLKPEAQLAGPGPVRQVEEVINDIRLPSRAAVEQQIGVGLLKSDQRGHVGMAARPDQAVTLSAAARAVSAILDGQTGAASRIVGSEPLLASSQLQPASAIAATLADAVNHSGLFYESHLAQFAAGTKSLAELAQEPQARLEASSKAALLLPGFVNAPGSPGAPRAMDGANNRTAMPAAPQSDAAATLSDQGEMGTASASPPAAGPDSALLAPAAEVTQAHKNAYASMQEAEGSMPPAKSHGDSATNGARSSAPALAGIHPDTVALVRQQLELLAQPAFRWTGEAWPAVPMDWDIQKDERQATSDQAEPRSWSTRLALTLPMLRDIELRISLAGNALQIRLAASEGTTLGLLHENRNELPARLREIGLELTGLQIGSLAAPAAANTLKADDGA